MDRRKRVAVAGFQHETNTFSPNRATYADFEEGGGWPPLTEGAAVLDVFASLNIPIGGFLTAASGQADVYPILWANAEPSNLVETAAYDRIAGKILDGIAAAGPLDGLYLDLHGAMVTEKHSDGEAELLRRVRERVGDQTPIVVSLDLHANISSELAARADALTIYRSYPHLDMAETGARAWALLSQMMATGERPAKAFRQSNLVLPLTAQCTEFGQLAAFYRNVALPERADVVSADAALGFPPADVPNMGPSVVAYGRNQDAADATAEALLTRLEDIADALANTLWEPDEAVREALRLTEGGGCAVLADVQDNSGAGAMSDTTGLLTALIDQRAGGAVLGALWDPAAVVAAQTAGPGGRFSARLGGRRGPEGVEPVMAEALVEALSDGRFTCSGAMQLGVETNIGPSALLRLDIGAGAAVRVLVSSRRHQCIDQEVFRHLGVEPAAQRIVAVKSTVHFRAHFAPMAKAVLMVAAPGHNPCRPERLSYRNLRPGMRFVVGRAVASSRNAKGGQPHDQR